MTPRRAPAPDADMRRRLLDLVERYPGLHLREAARQLRTSVALVEYHVPPLVESRDLTVTREERYVRLYPRGFDPSDEPLLAALRGPVALQLVLRLLENEPQRHGDLATALRIGKSGLSFHLRKLEAAAIVEQRDGGYALKDAKRVRGLLGRHKPTPDLQTEFAELWLNFYEG